MAPPREPTSRPQKFNSIGEVGRMTGVAPPRGVPRDSAGMERPDKFFDADSQGQSQSQSQPHAGPRLSQANQNNAARARARPDMYTELGERGRKTGVRVPQTRRDSDGFEDPRDFLGPPSPTSGHPTPAPSRTGGRSNTSPTDRSPPRANGASSASKKRAREDEDERRRAWDDAQNDDNGPTDFGGGGSDDEQGQQSADDDMDVDDGTSLTPSTFLRGNNGASRHAQPASARRVATLSAKAQGKRRKLSSASDVEDDEPVVDNDSDDEDDILPIAVSARQNGHKPAPVDSDSDDEPVRLPGRKGTKTMSASPNKSPARGSQPKKGHGKPPPPGPEPEDESEPGGQFEYEDDAPGLDDVAEDDEDESAEDDDAPRAKGKGKSRASDASSGQRSPSSPKRATAAEKGKGRAVPAPKKKPPVSNSAKANSGPSKKRQLEPEDPNVRRSGRQTVEPLEYWRNERVIYKRRQSGLGINKIVRIPKTSPEPLAKRKGGSKKRGASQSRVKSEMLPEEDGVDDMTDPDGIVLSWEGNCEATRRIAFTEKMMNPTPTLNNKFSFQKIYTELDYLAGGILMIPSGQQKPMKPAKDNSYLFYVIEGAVRVKIYRTQLSVGPGGTFFVPRGNMYEIEAISKRDAKLFFAQGRRVMEFADGTSRPDKQEDYQEGDEDDVEGDEESEGEGEREGEGEDEEDAEDE